MSGDRLQFENPIEDAVSRLRFSPESNNLLVASWDSVSCYFSSLPFSRILETVDEILLLLLACVVSEIV